MWIQKIWMDARARCRMVVQCWSADGRGLTHISATNTPRKNCCCQHNQMEQSPSSLIDRKTKAAESSSISTTLQPLLFSRHGTSFRQILVLFTLPCFLGWVCCREASGSRRAKFLSRWARIIHGAVPPKSGKRCHWCCVLGGYRIVPTYDNVIVTENNELI